MPIKLLFAGHNFNFFEEIIKLFKQHPDFVVKVDRWSGHNKHNVTKSKKFLNWADVIIANWCLGNAVWYSKHKKKKQKLFIRFRRHEITKKYPRQIKVKNVDKVLYSSPIFKKQFEKTTKLPKRKSVVVYNPINVEKLNQEKLDGSIFNLGMLGYDRPIKRADRAFEILKKLIQHDHRFKLFYKGDSPKKVPWIWKIKSKREFFQKLFKKVEKPQYKRSVTFEKWGKDVENWFPKIGFILSTSDTESFHSAVAEGMANGSIPMIMGWKGAKKIYPQEYVKSSVDEIVDYILQLVENPDLYHIKQQEVIDYSASHFALDKVFNHYVTLIKNSLKNNKKKRNKKDRSH